MGMRLLSLLTEVCYDLILLTSVPFPLVTFLPTDLFFIDSDIGNVNPEGVNTLAIVDMRSPAVLAAFFVLVCSIVCSAEEFSRSPS